tara:strand:+ start:50 stop:1009 length:960 start_codon:yes stop_codon:yes gene_type:complete
MALTKISRSLLDTGISDSSDATAITIDSSENVTVNNGTLTSSGANGVGNQGFHITDTGYSKTHKIFGDNSLHIQADSGQQILFKPNATEAARFDASGNLGIGTTSPDSHVTIDGGSDVRAEINLRSQTLGNTYNGGTIRFKGYHSNQASDGSRTWFEIRGQKENNTQGDVKGRIEMYINPGSNTMTEVMKIESNGDMFTNDGTVHSLASDSRVKSDVADLTDGLSIVSQLRPVTYKYNTKSEFYNPIDETTTRYGFIADEVKTVAPQYIKEGEGKIDGVEVDDFKTLSQTKMIPMLVKAIQELKEENDSLKSRIETLEG